MLNWGLNHFKTALLVAILLKPAFGAAPVQKPLISRTFLPFPV